jgi:tetratricopeptide (TPR) repeat protein
MVFEDIGKDRGPPEISTVTYFKRVPSLHTLSISRILTSVLVHIRDLQPDLQTAIVATFANGQWDMAKLQQVIGHEFDFLGPFTTVAIGKPSEDTPENTQLILSFEAPNGRDFAAAEKAFGKATRRGERGELTGAAEDLQRLISDWPEVAKYWRALGQARLVLEDWDKSEDALLKSLSLDPLDADAMTLLGNLYAKRNKRDRALALYRRSLELDRSVYALNNAGAMLAKLGEPAESLTLFREAVVLDPTFPNAWYGLGLTYANMKDVAVLPQAIDALDHALAAAGERSKSPDVWDATQGLLLQLAQIAANDQGNRAEPMIDATIALVSSNGGLPVEVETERLRGILAKIELGWVHHRAYHRVLINESAGVERVHQLRHELEHALLASAARTLGTNKWFASSEESLQIARQAVQGDANKLVKRGYDANEVVSLARSWVDGLNLQVYNTPVDLMIEQTLLREYPEFRELWFYALEKQLRTAVHIVENREIADTTARIVYRGSNAMNAAFALWFDEQFPRRTDILQRFRSHESFATGKKLYGMWKESVTSWTPGDELQWVDDWAHVLGMRGWYKWLDGNS